MGERPSSFTHHQSCREDPLSDNSLDSGPLISVFFLDLNLVGEEIRSNKAFLCSQCQSNNRSQPEAAMSSKAMFFSDAALSKHLQDPLYESTWQDPSGFQLFHNTVIQINLNSNIFTESLGLRCVNHGGAQWSPVREAWWCSGQRYLCDA